MSIIINNNIIEAQEKLDSIHLDNEEEKKLTTIKNSEVSYLNENSISTNASLLNNSKSKIENSYLGKSILINKPDFEIDIKAIDEEFEKRLEEQINNIKDPNLTEYEKRKLVLQNNATNTQDISISSPIRPIKEESISTGKNNNPKIVNPTDKKLEYNNNYNINDSKDISLSETSDNSQYLSNLNSLYPVEIKSFNPIRAKFYLKHNLNDIILYKNEMKLLQAEIYIIKDNIVGVVYLDDFITDLLSKSNFLEGNNEVDENIKGNFDTQTGIQFCEKEYKIGNETKRCTKNEFICSACMENNKKRYRIKNNYFINIKGRVAKVNKGRFHCFGHFLCGNKCNQIEDCITNFSCKACKMLDKYSKYYKNDNNELSL